MNRGKWSKPGVPHKGWKCIGVEDLEEPSEICEMCETQEIRYVHYMQHEDYPETLGVGCVCAENMEADRKAPRKREASFRNSAQRRKRWLTRSWRRSKAGNSFLNVDGMNIVVYQLYNGKWAARITDRHTDQSRPSRHSYGTEDEAKLAAFDGMIFLKTEYGWGD